MKKYYENLVSNCGRADTRIEYYELEGRINDIRITIAEQWDGTFYFSACLSGNTNKFGGLGFKKLSASKATAEEAEKAGWKKINNFIAKANA